MNHRACVLSGMTHDNLQDTMRSVYSFVKKRNHLDNGEHSDGGTTAASWRERPEPQKAMGNFPPEDTLPYSTSVQYIEIYYIHTYIYIEIYYILNKYIY